MLSGDRLSILIVDDDPEFNAKLCRSLAESGYRVEQAASAAARQLSSSNRFHAAVVDLNLADENPVELVREMNLRQRDLRIVATTGVQSDLYLDIAGYVGAQVTLRKFPALADDAFPASEWKKVIATAWPTM
jgi:ActR/RegA family two-component response regulator